MNRPVSVSTRETVAFIESHVPPPATVLEVGCGAGHVAVELESRGYHVIGVDSDERAIQRGQKRSAPVVKASWPEFSSAPVDAVVFTRSLHHIRPLEKAVSKAREVLQPGGTLLVEDFSMNEADARTINWFQKVLRSPTGRALIAPIRGQFVTKWLASRDPVADWHKGHDQALHTMATMIEAITEHFTMGGTPSVPYLYRYLVPVLPETPEAALFVEEIFREEARLGELGEIVLVGRRLVGSPRATS